MFQKTPPFGAAFFVVCAAHKKHVRENDDWRTNIATTLGIIGGGNITRLGSAQEIEAFFRIVELACSGNLPDEELKMVTGVLYRGNVKGEELDSVESAWRNIFGLMALVPVNKDIMADFCSETAREKLDWQASSWDEFFAAYKAAVLNAVEGARFEMNEFGLDPRIRIGASGIPEYKIVEERPDADYDNAGAIPFWLAGN